MTGIRHYHRPVHFGKPDGHYQHILKRPFLAFLIPDAFLRVPQILRSFSTCTRRPKTPTKLLILASKVNVLLVQHDFPLCSVGSWLSGHGPLDNLDMCHCPIGDGPSQIPTFLAYSKHNLKVTRLFNISLKLCLYCLQIWYWEMGKANRFLCPGIPGLEKYIARVLKTLI